jgi:hypothetical protein
MATKRMNTKTKTTTKTLSERNKLLAIRERLVQLKGEIDPHIMGRFSDKAVLKEIRRIERMVNEAVKQIESYLKTLPRSVADTFSDETAR